MYLLYLAALIGAVSGLDRLTSPELQFVNFARAIIGRKLNGSIIKEIDVHTESSCQFACVREARCLSYNFGPAEDKKTFKCQLCDSDRFVTVKNFTKNGEFLYRGTQSACEADPFLCGDKGVCVPDYQGKSFKCNCDSGCTGKPCKPKSCSRWLEDGATFDGIYTINPDGVNPMQVLCDMTTDNGGWTVFQRRLDGSVDFYLDWKSYKHGFGDLNGEFWLGNDNLHRLTAFDNVTLRVNLEDFDGNKTYAEYTTFKVADEADKYRLLIGGYSGTAGDSIIYQNAVQFSTNDNDNDFQSGNCALKYKGAWWYKSCHHSNLNGPYRGGQHDSFGEGVNWYTFRGHNYSLKRSEMKVRSVSQN